MNLARSIVLTVALSLVVAMLGAWAGAEYAMHHARPAAPLDELLHRKLNLTEAQQRQIEGLEQQHAIRRASLEVEMRAADADLARAISADHAYTPEAQAAIDRFHHAMGELQKETILHVLAMRAVLTPAQTAQFDQTVTRSLTQEAK